MNLVVITAGFCYGCSLIKKQLSINITVTSTHPDVCSCITKIKRKKENHIIKLNLCDLTAANLNIRTWKLLSLYPGLCPTVSTLPCWRESCYKESSQLLFAGYVSRHSRETDTLCILVDPFTFRTKGTVMAATVKHSALRGKMKWTVSVKHALLVECRFLSMFWRAFFGEQHFLYLRVSSELNYNIFKRPRI